MGKEFVKVHGDINDNTFHGEKDGYGYNFLESSPSGHMMFEATNPSGNSKLIEVDADGANELRNDPKNFWDTYIDK